MCCFGSTRGSPTAVWREDARGADARRACRRRDVDVDDGRDPQRCAGRALRYARTSAGRALRYARTSAAAASGARVRRRRIFRRIFRRRIRRRVCASPARPPARRSGAWAVPDARGALRGAGRRRRPAARRHSDTGARLRIARRTPRPRQRLCRRRGAGARGRRAAQRGGAALALGAGGERDRADGDGPHRRGARRLCRRAARRGGVRDRRPGERAAAPRGGGGAGARHAVRARNHWPTPGGLARWLGRGADAAGARAVGGFTTAFELVPLSLQRALATTDDYVGEGAEQRTRGFVPKAVLLRRYPLPWSLLVDASGDGYEATATFDRRPGPDECSRRRRRHQAQAGGAESGARGRAPRGRHAARARRRRRRARRRRRRTRGSLDGAAAPPTAPPSEEVRVYDFDEVQRVALPLYTAGCLLRLRHATAAAGGGDAQPAGLFDDDSDALHLYGAAPDGWGGRNPPELACCAVLRFGDEGGARVERSRYARPPRRRPAAARARRRRRAPPQRARRRARRRRSPRRACCSVARLRRGQAGVEGGGKIEFHSSFFTLTTLSLPFASAIAMPERNHLREKVLAQLHDHGVHDRRQAQTASKVPCEVALHG